MVPECDAPLLLSIARDAVRAASRGEPPPPPPPSLPPSLASDGAAFVTLHLNRELRGCVGHLHAHMPLWQSVQEMAVCAAVKDDRFDPLDREEEPGIAIDISILTPMRRVADPGEVVPGRDGIYLRRGPCSGLLLPQVAAEHGWDRETFLEQTCLKAGLSRDAWRDPATEISVFQVQKLTERS